MQPFLIRDLKLSELHESLIVLYRSFNRTIPPDLENQEKVLLSLINHGIAKFLVAEEGGKIIGLGGIFFFGDICSIGYMSVLPEVRRSGLGTNIFRNLVRIGKSKGCKTFMLYASELGEPIYQKFGFRREYYTGVYSLPDDPLVLQITDIKINRAEIFPNWAAVIDKNTMGFDRSKFLQLKINQDSILLTVEEEGFALVSGLRIGPIISKDIHTALHLINEGINLGANHIVVPKHSRFPSKIFKLAKLTEMDSDSNLKMIYGEEVTQNLDQFYALGTYAKG